MWHSKGQVTHQLIEISAKGFQYGGRERRSKGQNAEVLQRLIVGSQRAVYPGRSFRTTQVAVAREVETWEREIVHRVAMWNCKGKRPQGSKCSQYRTASPSSSSVQKVAHRPRFQPQM